MPRFRGIGMPSSSTGQCRMPRYHRISIHFLEGDAAVDCFAPWNRRYAVSQPLDIGGRGRYSLPRHQRLPHRLVRGGKHGMVFPIRHSKIFSIADGRRIAFRNQRRSASDRARIVTMAHRICSRDVQHQHIDHRFSINLSMGLSVKLQSISKPLRAPVKNPAATLERLHHGGLGLMADRTASGRGQHIGECRITVMLR